jgi:hypothetical protein
MIFARLCAEISIPLFGGAETYVTWTYILLGYFAEFHLGRRGKVLGRGLAAVV